MKVTLEWYELMTAGMVGLRRHVEALRKGLPDKHGFEGDGWGAHIEGACGEMALAKAINDYWDGSVNSFKRSGDVGVIQVRTRSKPNYDLIVRKDDRDGDIFVLVRGVAPTYEIAGWMRGKDAKLPVYEQQYGNRPKAWFVPASKLYHISLIPGK